MPSAAGHLCVAKNVSLKLNIMDNNYIKGNLIPDLEEDKNRSHYKIQGKKYLIPDINYVEKHLDLKDKTNLGILTHLLLDKYFLEEYLTPKFPDIDVFATKIIYRDYDILNKDVISYFSLDVEKIESILREIKIETYQEKLEKNISCLKWKEEGETTYLVKEDFIDFLEKISTRIAEEIKIYL